MLSLICYRVLQLKERDKYINKMPDFS